MRRTVLVLVLTPRVKVAGAMSVVFLAISPTFMVTAHCAAHLLIPALFRVG